MSDETSEAIFGDAIVDSLERPGRRGIFRWKKPVEEKPPFTHCEDCGEKLHGHYCSRCGQVAVDYRRSFRHVIADVLESFLNWDSKFTKTIGLLLISPGWLTNQFVAGRRTRYLHPLRLYLLVSVVFFLCARLLPMSPGRVHAQMSPADRVEVEKAMSDPNVPAAVREQVRQAMANAAKAPGVKGVDSLIVPAPPTPPAVAGLKNVPAPPKSDDGTSGNWLKRRVKEKVGPNGSNAQLLGSTLRNNISTMMLFCIPLFALVLKILYLRQRRFYIEHLVYALHIHAFFYIALLVIVLAGWAAKHSIPALETPLVWILSLALITQVFLSIRQVYRQSRLMTTFKFFFGGFIYFCVLVFALVVTAIATLALP
jgi:hypothetical protein